MRFGSMLDEDNVMMNELSGLGSWITNTVFKKSPRPITVSSVDQETYDIQQAQEALDHRRANVWAIKHPQYGPSQITRPLNQDGYPILHGFSGLGKDGQIAQAIGDAIKNIGRAGSGQSEPQSAAGQFKALAVSLSPAIAGALLGSVIGSDKKKGAAIGAAIGFGVMFLRSKD